MSTAVKPAASRASTFRYAFLILPREQRHALDAVYAFCRAVDDAVDLAPNPDVARRDLLEWRHELDRIFRGQPAHPIGTGLLTVVRGYDLPREHFDELLLGVAMDIGSPRYQTFAELERYAYRVASTVGLLCIPIFGCTGQRAERYAIARGLSLQLTNIIRDVKADAARDRIYLPQEDLDRFKYTEKELLASVYTSTFIDLMAFQCRRARDYHRRAHAALPDQRKLLAPEIMGHTYEALLNRIEASGYRLFDHPIRVPTLIKAGIALKSWIASRYNTASISEPV